MHCTIATKSLAVILAASATVALAETPETVVEGRSAYRERVSYTDLDLRRRDDQRSLIKRVDAAADRVCVQLEGPNYKEKFGISNYSRHPGWNCADYAAHDAGPQIKAAILAAESGKQMALSLSVSAPRLAR